VVTELCHVYVDLCHVYVDPCTTPHGSMTFLMLIHLLAPHAMNNPDGLVMSFTTEVIHQSMQYADRKITDMNNDVVIFLSLSRKDDHPMLF